MSSPMHHTPSSKLDAAALQSQLSPQASINAGAASLPRWSEFKGPVPGAIINIATEDDVQKTVQYCIQHNVPFLAQNGGNGWSTTFSLKRNGVIINLGGLKKVQFSNDKTRATVEGGALVSDVVAAASVNSALVATGVCNCVGYLGAVLGGGLGLLSGLYGFGVDNLESLNVVTPNGEAVTVSRQQNPDLWFAMRGAGPNFGIVTSAVIKAYPVGEEGLKAWIGPLIFAPNKLEAVIQAINDLVLAPEMALSMLWVSPGGNTTIIVNAFYYGSPEAGKEVFASLYAVGPVADRTAVVPYAEWNHPSEMPCKKGDRRPNYGVGLIQIHPPTWRAVFDEYLNFIKVPGAGMATVLLNAFALSTRSDLNHVSAYPFRHVKFFAGVGAQYADPSLDAIAVEYGTKVRALWQKTSGLDDPCTYINNAFGDESLSTVYGSSLLRLKDIKTKFDPHGRFNQWFPLL